MRLKTFTAETTAKAMDMVRSALGADAIIIGTQPLPGRRGVTVTAAIEEPDPDEAGLFDGWQDEEPAADPAGGRVDQALAFHGVPTELCRRLAQIAGRYDAEGAVLALAGALDQTLRVRLLSERDQIQPIMFVGPPGAGKTIACAKAMFRAQKAGRSVVAITCDMQRSGAFEQLEAFTRLLGIPLLPADGAGALRAVMAEAAAAGQLAIIDTAGVNPLSRNDLAQLSALVSAAAAEPVLVVAAGGDGSEAAETAGTFAAIGVQRLIGTKLDLSRRYGSVLAAAMAARLALAGVSISPHVADGFSPINPVSFARLLAPDTDGAHASVQPREAIP